MSEDFLPFYRRSGFWRFVVVWGPFLLFLLFFRKELVLAIKFVFMAFGSTTVWDPALFDLTVVGYAALKIILNIATFSAVYMISLFVVAQFILPVHTWHERVMAGRRLFSYWSGWHGPAVFVREGKFKVSQVGEEENIKPGVALVDLRSALVVEQTFPWVPENEIDPESDSTTPTTKSRFLFQKHTASTEDQSRLTRVYGPGINFTEWGEKIRDTIDLRPQMRRETGIKALTRDGIEVETNVFVGFSLSHSPEVMPVAYIGGNSAEHLFGLVIKDRAPGVIAITEKIKLDPEDAREIHSFVMAGGEAVRASAPVAAPANHSMRKSPFPFDEQRIFAAAYGQAYRGGSDPKTRWDELPALVAVEIFRSHLGQYTYDYLYLVDEPQQTPWLDEVKPEFSRKMRNQGLLSFKLVRLARSNEAGLPARWNLEPFEEKHLHQGFRDSELEFSSVYPLQNTYSKPLREHGIVILFAGFSELKPSPAIRAKMAERWKAKLDLEVKTILARNDREAMQVINNARTQAQRDATYFLSNLLKREKHSKEALALLLFQALQVAATDEKSVKELPPREIIGMMQNLHRWLLVEWEESEAKKKTREAKQPPSAAESNG